MQNLGNVYTAGPPFVMGRTDAHNGLDMVFNYYAFYLSYNIVETLIKRLFC
jgi:hypothetical protein